MRTLSLNYIAVVTLLSSDGNRIFKVNEHPYISQTG